jgi:hypothetical protein
MKHNAISIKLLLIGFLLGPGTATATLILPGPEVPLAESGGILDLIYGLGNLQRLDDTLDQIWFPANGTATAVAKFAGFNQNFGYIPDLNSNGFSDDAFVSLFNVSGNGIFSGPTSPFSSGNVNFLWALDPSGAPLWTSQNSRNSDGLDHMVSWLITGGVGVGNHVIAWEDLPGGGDKDFNDLVLEVSLAPIPVPEPSIIALFGLGLLGLGFARRRKA